MIVARATEVRELLAEVDTLQRAASEAEGVGATLRELDSLHAALLALRQTQRRITGRLPVEANRQLRADFARFVDGVRASREDFEQRPLQANKLRAITVNVVGGHSQQLNAAWATYANAEVRPYTSLLELVQSLPEMQARAGYLRRLRDRLGELAAHAPTNDSELAEFDDKLQRLREELDRIEGLTVPVQTFLRRVINGTATLTDLTDEVLAWCRQGDRAASFELRFRGGR